MDAEACPRMQGIKNDGSHEECGAVKSNQLAVAVVLMVGRLLAEE